MKSPKNSGFDEGFQIRGAEAAEAEKLERKKQEREGAAEAGTEITVKPGGGGLPGEIFLEPGLAVRDAIGVDEFVRENFRAGIK